MTSSTATRPSGDGTTTGSTRSADPAGGDAPQARRHRQANHAFALIALTTLFFMWGLIASLNDILIPHLKALLDLSYVEAMLIQFCFFGAYFVMSFPWGYFVERVGYRSGIVGSGVLCMAIVGGAIVPVIAGYVADLSTIAYSVIVSVICYLYIVYYGLKGHEERGRTYERSVRLRSWSASAAASGFPSR